MERQADLSGSKKKLLVVGPNLRNYARNSVLLDAFAEHYELNEVLIPETLAGHLLLFRTLIFKGRSCDAILFLHPTIRFSPIMYAFHVFSRKKLIGDAFISMYDTNITDRELAEPNSLKGYYYRMLDALYVRAVDALIFDTPEHGEYFDRTFGIPRHVKHFVFPISVDLEAIDAIRPALPPEIADAPGKKTVLFFGNYIPLQGVQYIIQAIAEFKSRDDVRFLMVGNGQTRPDALKQSAVLGITNIQFIEWIPAPSVIALVKKCDVSLGIFGDTEKARRVIPNKAVEAMAAGVVVVSGRSVPVERYFKENMHIFYAQFADPKDIARAIDEALRDPEKRAGVAREARKVIDAEFSKERLIERVRDMISL
jgi:glycosyltransferase involved in cell wall biosynthesis